jgi:leucyl aminopeptidase (aminopeptidase T)
MNDPYRTVLTDCLGLKAGESLLILADPDAERMRIARRLTDMGRELGAETVLIEMSERETHGSEPPDLIAAAMLACDVFIAPTTKSVSHTEARRAACEKGVRAATMPQITEDMLERTMAADFIAVKRRSQALADLLTSADHVHITTELGTDIRFEIAGREGISDDGDLTAPGAFGNLPAGEGFIAPLEGKTNGLLVVDATIWPIGQLSEPLHIEVKDGYAVGFEGKHAKEFEATLEPHGREAYAVAELGIGTNEMAKVTGNVLEDEKIMGTIHVAFGDNHSFGGTVRVSSHQDGIVLKPTVEINGKRVLEGGCLLV